MYKIKRRNTYGSTMTSLGNQTQIGRKSTLVACTGSLFIGVRRGHVIRELSWSLEHLSLVIRTVLVLDFFSHNLDLIYGVRNTDKVTPGNAVKRVTCGTDFTVDLVSTTNAKEDESQ